MLAYLFHHLFHGLPERFWTFNLNSCSIHQKPAAKRAHVNYQKRHMTSAFQFLLRNVTWCRNNLKTSLASISQEKTQRPQAFYSLWEKDLRDYQKTIYNAARIPQTIAAPTANAPSGLNIFESISNPRGLFLPFGSTRLMTTITATTIKNTKPIRSINGISKTADSGFLAANPYFCNRDKSANLGRNLNNNDNGKVMIAATSAAVAVVRFQKNPRIKIAKIPGETNPVYS